jgi:hypothetical protein
VLLQAGCLSFGGRNTECDGERSEAVTKRELAELLKLHRLCLQKNEENITKARENCAVYREAIHDLTPADQRASLMDVLDRALNKSRSTL